MPINNNNSSTSYSKKKWECKDILIDGTYTADCKESTYKLEKPGCTNTPVNGIYTDNCKLNENPVEWDKLCDCVEYKKQRDSIDKSSKVSMSFGIISAFFLFCIFFIKLYREMKK